jgi:dTDP-glucose 4,6-dehydratase
MDYSMNGKMALITGATGFVGSFLTERLLKEGVKVRAAARSKNFRTLSTKRFNIEFCEGDLRDFDYCESIVDGVDIIFHFASCRRSTPYHNEFASTVAEENVRMTLSLLHAVRTARKKKEVRVVFLSTANVPPTLDTVSVAQEKKSDGYILGKALCETLWFLGSRQADFPLLTLRPVGAYGPRDTFTEDSNVIPSLFYRTQNAKDVLTVWGSGNQERGFLYVEDMVSAILLLVQHNISGIQYIPSTTTISIRALAEKIRDLVQPGLPIVFDTSKPDGLRTIPLLPAHELLQTIAWTDLTEGLTLTFKSFLTRKIV